ncbi:MAG: hypothetical protein HY735_01870 [Verrucomicrobia bacterium]|nr:hypothetical protein [Verrucomicrobiota bacterium]
MEVEERVDRVEVELAQFTAQSKATIRHMDELIARSDQRLAATERVIAELKEDARKHTLEMARIADRIGRFAEDIVGPNIPRLAREVFGIAQAELRVQRIDKPSRKDPSQWREFDFVITGHNQLIITETKSTARVKYIDEFAESLKDIFDYFPEFQGYKVVPIFASMALSPEFVRRLTRHKIYALALGERTMELLNLEQVRTRRANGK